MASSDKDIHDVFSRPNEPLNGITKVNFALHGRYTDHSQE